MNHVRLFTIGFTKTNAEGFFERLQKARVKTVIDVRLHNTSQLAAFAKADDLAYFLKTVGTPQDFNVRIANDGNGQLTIGRAGSAIAMGQFSGSHGQRRRGAYQRSEPEGEFSGSGCQGSAGQSRSFALDQMEL